MASWRPAVCGCGEHHARRDHSATTFEWDEWGDPRDSVYYHYMKSYSPYDQVAAQDYPNTLVTTGYWDSQVQYWEPAKWVAKLRELKTDDARSSFMPTWTPATAVSRASSAAIRRWR